MKIKQLEIRKIEIPMTNSFTTSFGNIKHKATIIVKITDEEGFEGYGEAASLPYPIYNPETTDIIFLVLKDYIAPLILNREFKDASELLSFMNPIKNHNFAKTSIENAVWMILALKQKQPISKLLGGVKEKIAVGESIGIKRTIEETLDEVALRKVQGYQRTKIKIKPGWDIKVVEAIRRKFGNIDLMVDGNSAYSLLDIDILKKLDKYNLIMIEQPLGDEDIIDHAELQKQIKTPICLDESIHSADDARKSISINACKIINIKPGRVGGLLESKKIHDLCQKNNIGVWCGGMLETGIGRAFNIAIASLPNFIYPADMSPYNIYFEDDLVTESFIVDKNGYIKVPKKQGLGFEINNKKLEKYTIAKLQLE